MFGPIEVVGDQLDDSGVNNLNRNLETMRSAPTAAFKESRRGFLKRTEHAPEKLFGHGRIANFVGMGEAVATGGSAAANGGQGALVELKGIANVIEADGMCQLGMKQRDDMAPVGEVARFLVRASFSGQLGNKVRRNEVANLFEDVKL